MASFTTEEDNVKNGGNAVEGSLGIARSVSFSSRRFSRLASAQFGDIESSRRDRECRWNVSERTDQRHLLVLGSRSKQQGQMPMNGLLETEGPTSFRTETGRESKAPLLRSARTETLRRLANLGRQKSLESSSSQNDKPPLLLTSFPTAGASGGIVDVYKCTLTPGVQLSRFQSKDEGEDNCLLQLGKLIENKPTSQISIDCLSSRREEAGESTASSLSSIDHSAKNSKARWWTLLVLLLPLLAAFAFLVPSQNRQLVVFEHGIRLGSVLEYLSALCYEPTYDENMYEKPVLQMPWFLYPGKMSLLWERFNTEDGLFDNEFFLWNVRGTLPVKMESLASNASQNSVLSSDISRHSFSSPPTIECLLMRSKWRDTSGHDISKLAPWSANSSNTTWIDTPTGFWRFTAFGGVHHHSLRHRSFKSRQTWDACFIADMHPSQCYPVPQGPICCPSLQGDIPPVVSAVENKPSLDDVFLRVPLVDVVGEFVNDIVKRRVLRDAV